ncbi:UDP-3-O-[3-hydroxymyristoyl] N-acetylglucosamine deacetylase [Hasllibacter halocynthiae]|uniref:UDP-3-O-acyl-N-acetylglucosamine deacetylase n=1 Tax=Hasllibacter halocynthiae TaxID=595589 RepID=A0A2T0X9G7_9RHOB|nr:UDP-3-O-acyl-N-acetylglucosamine deacetylase [Hasllibacter halocynthiae]PRY95569.1 UDP-3-O-[3-hydroxymyristoyl] N-acetylglucosamine deacetylase [Hasllibacter halocynthiae]
MQATLRGDITIEGRGLHSGALATLRLRPAPADHGIWFRRTDVSGRDPMVPALWDVVTPTELCTRLENEDGVAVRTTEHLMAALWGCGVRNALVEIDAEEVPILDGSSRPFAEAILARGIVPQAAPVVAIEILAPVEVRRGEAFARLEPATAPEMRFEIDFADAAIGRQEYAMATANGSFLRELSDSRTFCRKSDVDAMQARGLALGGTLENAVVVDGANVLSPGGLRRRDEAVRHKMLDAFGDLALAGMPILGRYVGHRAGHALTNQLLRALFADPSAYHVVACDEACAQALPGAHVVPADLPRAI